MRVPRPYMQTVLVEVLEKRPGIWCPQCRALTGVALTTARHQRTGGMTVLTITRCTECRTDL